MEYKDYRIYVMHFNDVFQYLITDKEKNLYQDHVTIPSTLLNKIKHRLHLIPVQYTKEEMEVGENIVLDGAIKSIDALIENIKVAKKEMKEVAKVANSHKVNKECTWRARTGDNGQPVYECLNHEIAVPMIDGEKPFHEMGILSPIQQEALK